MKSFLPFHITAFKLARQTCSIIYAGTEVVARLNHGRTFTLDLENKLNK